MQEEKYDRYESPALIQWKKQNHEKQLETVISLSQEFEHTIEVVNVLDQRIEVIAYVTKDKIYELLVQYETFIRVKLNDIPIIVLLKEKRDENRKRK